MPFMHLISAVGARIDATAKALPTSARWLLSPEAALPLLPKLRCGAPNGRPILVSSILRPSPVGLQAHGRLTSRRLCLCLCLSMKAGRAPAH